MYGLYMHKQIFQMNFSAYNGYRKFERTSEINGEGCSTGALVLYNTRVRAFRYNIVNDALFEKLYLFMIMHHIQYLAGLDEVYEPEKRVYGGPSPTVFGSSR